MVTTPSLFNKGQSIRDSTDHFGKNKGHLASDREKNKGQQLPYVVTKIFLCSTSLKN